jgi:hypothetical protein
VGRPRAHALYAELLERGVAGAFADPVAAAVHYLGAGFDAGES